jgi:hypothetical protein
LFKKYLENEKNEVQLLSEMKNLFEEFTNLYFDRDIYHNIFTERTAPKTKNGKTLEELGLEFRVTRERIRQIELKIKDKLISYFNYLSVALKNINLGDEIKIENEKIIALTKIYNVLILLLISLKGSILVGEKYFEIVNQLKFIFNYLKIELEDEYFEDYYLINISAKDINYCFNIIKSNKIYRLGGIIKCLIDKFGNKFKIMDINDLSKILKKIYFENLSGIDFVYISLKELGGAAHYSEIAKKCIELFGSNDRFSPRNILAYLTREPNLSKNKLPWVWLGSRGVYGLKELGYLKPEKILFDEITYIVEDEFLKSHRPVSISKIKSEILKKRPFVNENSLMIACSLNEKVKYLNKIKCCVPVEFLDDFQTTGLNEEINELNEHKDDKVNEDFIDDVLSRYEN